MSWIWDLLGLKPSSPSVKIIESKDKSCADCNKQLIKYEQILLNEFSNELGKRCKINLVCTQDLPEKVAAQFRPIIRPTRTWYPTWRKYAIGQIEIPCCSKSPSKSLPNTNFSDINIFKHEATHAMDFCDSSYPKYNEEDIYAYIPIEINAYNKNNIFQSIKEDEKKKLLSSLVKNSINDIARQRNVTLNEDTYNKRFDEYYNNCLQ